MIPRLPSRHVLVASAALLLGSAAPAFAQDGPPSPAKTEAEADIRANLGKDTITVGVLGVYIPDYEGSNDYRLSPAPLVLASVGGFNFSLLGNRASLDLIPDHGKWDFQAGPIVKVNFNRSSVNSIEDPRVKALGKRSTGFALGGYIGIGKTGVITSPYDKLLVSVSYRKGLTTSGLGTWEPSVTYATPLSTKSGIAIHAAAEYSGNGYANKYFSVSAAESLASGLPAYTAHEGWRDWNIGAIYTQSITGNLLHGFKVVVGGSYTRLMNDFGYSPIVRIAGSKTQWLGTAGVAYTF